MTENNNRRPILIASFSAVFAAADDSCAQENSAGSRENPRSRPQLFHRVIHTIHNAPVDITVDKGTPPLSEKAQQNQHFTYHRAVRYSYGAVNNPLTSPHAPRIIFPPRAIRMITPVWNMHRSGAACSLNVTSIGICLSRQQYVVTAISHSSLRILPPPLTHSECGTIVKPTFGMLAAHELRVFPGTS